MDAEVSRASFTIAYSGYGRLDDHTMDVDLLAPALLGFGRLIREANAEFNGKKAKANVRVISDFEHKCFQINFETVLTYYQQLKTFLETSNVQSAKNVLEWIGLVTTTVGTPYVSYFAFLRYRRGRKIESRREISDESGQGLVQIRFEGDVNFVTVHNHIVSLAENPKVLKATQDAFSPIGSDGFSRIEVKEGDETSNIIDASQAEDILASCAMVDEGEPDAAVTDETTAWLSVYSPVYDQKADKWRFKLGTEHVYVDISGTDIAKDAIDRGGTFVDDTYYVRLELTYPDGDRHAKPAYKILEVLKFIQAERPAKQFDIEDVEPEDPPKITQGR